MSLPKFGSQKFFAFWISVFIIIGIPILYQHLGIDVSITLLVVTALATVCLGYKIANVFDTRIDPPTVNPKDPNDTTKP